MRLENNDVVNHKSCQHDNHLQLIVYPQEHRAGDQPQYAAVNQILGEKQNDLLKVNEDDHFFFESQEFILTYRKVEVVFARERYELSILGKQCFVG